MECTAVNGNNVTVLYTGEGILLKSTQYEPMHPSPPATAPAHANTFPRNRINPLAEITNFLCSEFPTSLNRVRYKLLQYKCWHLQRNVHHGFMDPGLITHPI